MKRRSAVGIFVHFLVIYFFATLAVIFLGTFLLSLITR